MTAPDDPTVGKLQDIMIESALTRRPLPGLGSPLRLPDVGMVRREGLAMVVSDGYFGLPERLPDVRVVGAGDVSPGAAALRFEVRERGPDAVSLALDVVGVPPTGQASLTPLGRAEVTFARRPDGWQVSGDPVYLST